MVEGVEDLGAKITRIGAELSRDEIEEVVEAASQQLRSVLSGATRGASLDEILRPGAEGSSQGSSS